jgi:plastocyanin
VSWPAVVLAAVLAAAPAAPPRKPHHRVTTAHRLAKKPPKHKGVVLKRPRVTPLPSASPVPQGSPGQPGPTATPTPTPTPDWRPRTGVDLDDRSESYRLTPTYRYLKAGTVQFLPVNYGMDDHNLSVATVDDPSDPIGAVDVPADRQTYSLVLDLPPGQYRLYCSLQNHAQLGMQATVTVGG